MYEVNDSGYYLVMENLFLGMSQDVTVYDLKGSETNRWETRKKRVLLDTNFKIDRNSEPLPVSREQYRLIGRALQVSQYL
jgi:hypothetical protein